MTGSLFSLFFCVIYDTNVETLKIAKKHILKQDSNLWDDLHLSSNPTNEHKYNVKNNNKTTTKV